MNKYVLLFLFGVLISNFAQVILKLSANQQHKNIAAEYLNSKVIGAYAIFFIAAFINVIALKGIYTKEAPILEATGYIFILIMGRIFLKEKITKKKLIGNLIIIIGMIIFNM